MAPRQVSLSSGWESAFGPLGAELGALDASTIGGVVVGSYSASTADRHLTALVLAGDYHAGWVSGDPQG